MYNDFKVELIPCTQFGFDLGEQGEFDCESVVGAVGGVIGAILDAVAPELIWLVEAGIELGELGCAASEVFNPKSTRDLETEKTDAALARAWEKEMRRERVLPMPEHKKRELGLID